MITRLEALLKLNLTFEIGFRKLEKLLAVFGTPEAIAERIQKVSAQDVEEEIRRAQKLGLKIISYEDEGYPAGLGNICDRPLVLYVKGEINPQDSLSLAIVGSRYPSVYGMDSAYRMAFELAKEGLTVVSGLARGIDSQAHRGALDAGGRTLAVIGSGFANLYPPENASLAEAIAGQGAVISEFPLSAKPLKQNFPRRNRLISGLSRGVLVVEASENSGALITVDYALEQGREVFAVPGRIDNPKASGSNRLIREGAVLASSSWDIIDELDLPAEDKKSCNKSEFSGEDPDDPEEKMICACLKSGPLFFDEIVEKLKIAVTQAAAVILRLRLKGSIDELPGKRFALKKEKRDE